MTMLTIQETSRQTGLSEPTLRYYEEVGLIGPIARDDNSGHRRYRESDLDALQALACLRAMGVGIEDMRTYQANRALGAAAAGEQRDLLLRHADRGEAGGEAPRVAGAGDGGGGGDGPPRAPPQLPARKAPLRGRARRGNRPRRGRG